MTHCRLRAQSMNSCTANEATIVAASLPDGIDTPLTPETRMLDTGSSSWKLPMRVHEERRQRDQVVPAHADAQG